MGGARLALEPVAAGCIPSDTLSSVQYPIHTREPMRARARTSEREGHNGCAALPIVQLRGYDLPRFPDQFARLLALH